MFEELDTAVLNHNIEKHGLKKGDVGTVVHVYPTKAVEVEFITAKGKTVAVLTLTNSDIRPIERNEILHVRGFATA
ncbi:DUF4926 domain-containing protein [Candidatus Microgenomates bacterium]|nr:DUF4926 domain-containing protein [Candidatus Microgenomates bacterium]